MQTILDRDINKRVFKPPELGCVLYLSGLPSGGSKIYDRSAYGNIGAITGATWVRLPSGLWCLSFDGTDDTVLVGNATCFDITGELTLEVWVKTSDKNKIIMGKNHASSFYLHEDINGYIRFYTGNTNISGQTDVTDGVWHHIVARRKATDRKIFFDASEDQSSTTAGTITTDTDSVYLGRSGTIDTTKWKGYLALPRIYNRALSALEIANHFNQEKHLFGVW